MQKILYELNNLILTQKEDKFFVGGKNFFRSYNTFDEAKLDMTICAKR